jgi:hypothetical protein
MARPIATQRLRSARCRMGLTIALLGMKGSQRFLLGLLRRTYSRIVWTTDALCRHNLAIHNSQLILAGNGDSYLYRSRSLSHWIRMELARSQCRQIITD